MTYPLSHPLRCHLPPGRARAFPGHAQQMAAPQNGVTRTLPQTYTRGGGQTASAAALATHGVIRHLPRPVSRSMSLTGNGGQSFPESQPGSATTDSQKDAMGAGPSVSQGRASDIPVDALLRIVERTAIRISGQAGYAFTGAEPDGAGLRFGLLGLRLDTGDMGGAFRMALARDPGLSGLLGDAADAIQTRVLGGDPVARLRPMEDGKALWDAPYKTLLSALGQHPASKAGQNRFAVEELLTPAVNLLIERGIALSGPLLAKVLATLAALGHEAGLLALSSALDGGESDILAALLRACPACAEHFAALDTDAVLVAWAPGGTG